MHRVMLCATVLVCLALAAGFTLLRAPSAEALVNELVQAYRNKLDNPEYVAWKSQPGIPSLLPDFPEERQIKLLRGRLAALAVCPAGVEPLVVPVAQRTPQIDGRLASGEWDQALVIPMGNDGRNTQLRMMCDDQSLYLACEVPSDTTHQGFDQFRFYFHVNLCPQIDNERIHVGTGRNDIRGGIRQTNLRWQGPPARSHEERWMNYDISDWQIFSKARGLSSVDEYRQYEASLNLVECGLLRGVPFAAFSEVETDEARDAQGKFDHRVYAGSLGTQGNPMWFRMPRQ